MTPDEAAKLAFDSLWEALNTFPGFEALNRDAVRFALLPGLTELFVRQSRETARAVLWDAMLELSLKLDNTARRSWKEMFRDLGVRGSGEVPRD